MNTFPKMRYECEMIFCPDSLINIKISFHPGEILRLWLLLCIFDTILRLYYLFQYFSFSFFYIIKLFFVERFFNLSMIHLLNISILIQFRNVASKIFEQWFSRKDFLPSFFYFWSSEIRFYVARTTPIGSWKIPRTLRYWTPVSV